MRWIHDVSTDVDDPPAFVALRAVRLACPNGVDYSGVRSRGAAAIEPLSLPLPPAAVFESVLAAVRTMQWRIADARTSAGRIEATAVTPLFRFKDDIVIRIRAEGSGTRLDMRSASRIGKTDLGANARRIRHFLHRVKNLFESNT